MQTFSKSVQQQLSLKGLTKWCQHYSCNVFSLFQSFNMDPINRSQHSRNMVFLVPVTTFTAAFWTEVFLGIFFFFFFVITCFLLGSLNPSDVLGGVQSPNREQFRSSAVGLAEVTKQFWYQLHAQQQNRSGGHAIGRRLRRRDPGGGLAGGQQLLYSMLVRGQCLEILPLLVTCCSAGMLLLLFTDNPNHHCARIIQWEWPFHKLMSDIKNPTASDGVPPPQFISRLTVAKALPISFKFSSTDCCWSSCPQSVVIYQLL